ncbi:MAG TPA: hypothetical protein VI230_05890, partial [Ignavibacteriaceae bacterium]
LTWETAADSIMSAINISFFGDTIYVANGVYEEQVVMIPGLSLIGAGMDSCIIDARSFEGNSVLIQDSCIFSGFRIICATYKWCVYDSGSTGSTISFNQLECFSQNGGGIDVQNLDTSNSSNIFIYQNQFNNVTIAIDLFNSDAIVRKNYIHLPPNSQAALIAGIYISAYFLNFYPDIDSNYIELSSVGGWGIRKDYGARPIISNNTIKLIHGQTGIFIGYTDSAKVYNNLIIGKPGIDGITDGFEQIITNNTAANLSGAGFQISGTVVNNLAINSRRGIEKSGNPIVEYNNSWNNGVNFSGFTPDSTNLSVNPMVINEDTTNNGPDFHLQKYSPLINKGDPNILDKDSTRSDIGLYGGPYGEVYKYIDLSPRSPVNLSATLDSSFILISWNRNTEADFSHYNLFRDTTENFPIDSTTFVASLTDTFYSQIIPPGIADLYFKLTAVDRQGNQSEPSEELHIILTGINDKKQITISNYQLYQNYPNPFNPTTKIGYRLKERGYVKLYVYDIKGELIETLVNKYQEGGYYEVEFSAGQGSGPEIASGVYIYQLMVRNEQNIPVYTDIKKMVYLK